MDIEKEVRYLIKDSQYQKILSVTQPLEQESDTLDLNYGYDGFNSLAKFGFICRVRKKKNKIVLEIKKRIEDGWLEQEVKVDSILDGINFFECLNMKPYMFLYKKREIRTFGDLKIFIDKVKGLGDFVEIEYQDCENSLEKVEEFKTLVKINSSEQDLYGNILMEKLKDKDFQEQYQKELYDLISEFKVHCL